MAKKKVNNQIESIKFLSEESPLLIVITDLDGKIIYVNKKFTKITGYTKEEAIGRNPRILKSRDMKKDNYKKLWKTITSGKIWRGDLHNKTKAGEDYWAHVSIMPLMDERKNITHFMGMQENITDTKELEIKYKELFDKMLNGFAYHKIITNKKGEPIDYEFIEVNKAFEKLTGLKNENIVGKRVTKIIKGIEKDPAKWIEKYGEVALKNKTFKTEMYAEPLKKWYSIYAYSPKKGEFVTIFEDITGRKKKESEAAFERHLLNTLMNQSADVIYFKDLKSRFIKINKAHAKLFKLKNPQEAIGKTDSDFFVKEHGEKRRKDEEQIIKTGKSLPNIEEHEKWPDGSETWAFTSKGPFYGTDGKIAGTFGISRDITGLKNKSKETERFNELSIGRELKMIELKKEINNLKEKIGEKNKYKIVEEEDEV